MPPYYPSDENEKSTRAYNLLNYGKMGKKGVKGITKSYPSLLVLLCKSYDGHLLFVKMFSMYN
jgi:hypothetical protein